MRKEMLLAAVINCVVKFVIAGCLLLFPSPI
jgi:hypothetical protein